MESQDEVLFAVQKKRISGKSVFNNYYDEIVLGLRQLKSLTEIHLKLEDRYKADLNYDGLRHYISRNPTLNGLKIRAQEEIRKMKSGSRVVSGSVDEKELDLLITYSRNSNQFVNWMFDQFGGIDEKDAEKRDSPMNFAYSSFIFLCRAILVARNPKATIFEVSKAQDVYLKAVTGLTMFANDMRNNRSSGLVFDFGVEGNGQDALTQFENFIHKLEGNYNASANTQSELEFAT